MTNTSHTTSSQPDQENSVWSKIQHWWYAPTPATEKPHPHTFMVLPCGHLVKTTTDNKTGLVDKITEVTDPKELKEYATAAAVGAVGGGAVPALATTTIGVLGYGTGGIAAGSTAAGMMSSAAVAGTGGVASGSTVAALQSIGAAGIGAGPIAGCVVAGALLCCGGYALYKHYRNKPKSSHVDKAKGTVKCPQCGESSILRTSMV